MLENILKKYAISLLLTSRFPGSDLQSLDEDTHTTSYVGGGAAGYVPPLHHQTSTTTDVDVMNTSSATGGFSSSLGAVSGGTIGVDGRTSASSRTMPMDTSFDSAHQLGGGAHTRGNGNDSGASGSRPNSEAIDRLDESVRFMMQLNGDITDGFDDEENGRASRGVDDNGVSFRSKSSASHHYHHQNSGGSGGGGGGRPSSYQYQQSQQHKRYSAREADLTSPSSSSNATARSNFFRDNNTSSSAGGGGGGGSLSRSRNNNGDVQQQNNGILTRSFEQERLRHSVTRKETQTTRHTTMSSSSTAHQEMVISKGDVVRIKVPYMPSGAGGGGATADEVTVTSSEANMSRSSMPVSASTPKLNNSSSHDRKSNKGRSSPNKRLSNPP